MNNKIKLGLIGRNISYSFSKKFFKEKFRRLMVDNYSYDIFDLQDISEVESLFIDSEIKGFNVTIPYKVEIIPYLDELSDEAEKIGAVNCVSIKDGKKIGHNTDAFGFQQSLSVLSEKPQSALILGNGGAAKAVQYVLNKQEIPFKIISRNGEITYNNLRPEVVEEHQLIVQCTPVGTFPNIDDCLEFPFENLSEKHSIIDLIYNPDYTQFIQRSAKKGAKTLNGLFMLEQQAEKFG